MSKKDEALRAAEAALERASTLLVATRDFIEKNPVSEYAVFFDEAECDGGCLSEDAHACNQGQVTPALAQVRAALEESEWHGMESAPRDGTPVLIWGPKFANSFSAYWTNEQTDMSKEGGWTDGSTNRYDEFYASFPTHWRPLPPPPTDKGVA